MIPIFSIHCQHDDLDTWKSFPNDIQHHQTITVGSTGHGVISYQNITFVFLQKTYDFRGVFRSTYNLYFMLILQNTFYACQNCRMVIGN